MPFKSQNLVMLVIFLLVSGSILQACSSKPAIVGTWISEAPANLTFQFREDGSVWLLTDQQNRQIWRYEVDGKDILHLTDGIGRKQEFRFTIQEDTLTFSDPTTGVAVEKYTRVNP